MSLPQVLEVTIGLVVVYYVLGLVVSTATQMVIESAETRGVALEKYLKQIVGDRRLEDLTHLPQIMALRPVRYESAKSVFRSTVVEKKVEKIPTSVLVDAFFDITGLSGPKEIKADELINIIGQLPDSDGKQAMLKWTQQGITDINELRNRASTYIGGMLDQAAATFKANARSLVIIFSILVTLLFGTDSIALADQLWKNAELRAIAAAQASTVVQQEGTTADLTSLIDNLGSLTIKIGWWQTAAYPTTANAIDWIKFIFFKALGLSITAAAVSQGSSFWYDILKKLTGTSSKSSEASGAAG